MSKALLNQYYKEVHIAKQRGNANEETLKTPFFNLINGMAQEQNLAVVREIFIRSSIGTNIRPDGILRNSLQFDYGYWESKDQKDDFEKEIQAKFDKGYPRNNILFDDTQKTILFQDGKRYEASIYLENEILPLLNRFITYERPEVKDFNTAVTKFGENLPDILKVLRTLLDQASVENQEFQRQRNKFLLICQQSINPNLSPIEVREMLIQHILTEEIFVSVFGNADYHRDNNVAQTLYELERTFFKGESKQNLLASIRPYYNKIKSRATEMVTHTDKQGFLKVVYENFYKAYNPKGADRLGIVYTPTEIVKFMIEGTDFLLDKHFEKTLGDRNVEILDPCTGTGTYICELIEHIPAHQLEYKFRNEIHANEVALLPYYVANLNIEAVYQAKMENYIEFNNLCFVDTLDNTAALAYEGKQNDFFGQISLENFRRIKVQNTKKISVIIGNPPYNAHQENYNLQNANRLYADIDRRIKETYVKTGTAQRKGDLYDMYVRFVRWATDRLNGNGIVAFVTNRSFINARTFDGFRKEISKDFQEIWILDTKSDVRTNPKIAGTTHNVFGIQTGVCISFLIKNETLKNEKCRIFYFSLEDEQRKKEKLDFLRYEKIKTIPFERIRPDKKGNWINQTDNDFDSLIPLINKDVKAGKSQEAIFELFSNGLKTGRDSWAYDLSKKNLIEKMRFFIEIYQKTIKNPELEEKFAIKWGIELDNYRNRKIKKKFSKNNIVPVCYRPFTKQFLYYDQHFNQRTYRWADIYEPIENQIIAFSGLAHSKTFQSLAFQGICDLGFAEGCQCLPLYRYKNGEKVENITDWALALFEARYESVENRELSIEDRDLTVGNTPPSTLHIRISKLDIFHYVYAVLHDPKYCTKYAQNLKREFPRIPLYADFWKWANAGKELMDLHLNYENVGTWDLGRENRENTTLDPLVPRPKISPKLKANKELGEIYIDDQTTLKGVPKIAWEYKLGNRSALEWVLDQYKESKPSDPTILEKFNTYRFADYKEEVIELLQKVCAVSVRTMEIIKCL